MANKKNTRRALWMSVMSLILCFAMLVGTTFAWFTDEVKSGLNEIKAGNLDIELLRNGSEKVTEDVMLFDNVDLWEPGVVAYENLTLQNAGDLALKYTMSINYADQTVMEDGSKLSDVLQVAVLDQNVTGMTREEVLELAQASANKGSLASFSMEGELAEGGSTTPKNFVIFWEPGLNDNAYNLNNDKKAVNADGTPAEALLINFGIHVYATQLAYESDSFGPDYDESTAVEVTTAAELIAALAKGGSILLTGDITAVETITVPAGVSVALNLDGHTITAAKAKDTGAVLKNEGSLTLIGGTMENPAVNGDAVISNAGSLTLDGVTIKGAPMDETGYPAYAVTTSGKLTVEDGTVIEADRGAISTSSGAEVVINGGTVKVSDAANGRTLTLHTIYAYGSGSKLTINGGEFENNYNGASGASVICPAGAAISIYGGNFRDAVDDTSNFNNTANIQNYMGYGVPVNIYGGTFDDNTVTKNIASGYEATEENGIWTVSHAVKDETTLADAIANAQDGDVIPLPAGNFTIPTAVAGKEITITGSGDDTVFDFTKVNSVGDASITFENVKFVGQNANNMSGFGIQSTTGDIVYKNCTFENAVTNEYYGTVTYDHCTFIGTYYITTYAVKSATFTGCTFDRTDSRAILVYSHGDHPVNVTVENCTFKADAKGYTGVPAWTAAVEVDTTNIPTAGTTVTINNCTYDENYNGIVRDKSAAGKANAVITVDGKSYVSEGLFKDADGNYYVYNAAGLQSLKNWMDENSNRGSVWGKTYNIMADIDASSVMWNSKLYSPDSDTFTGITFNGNGHTISNLTITGNGLFTGATKGATVKDITFDNVTVTGGTHHNGVVWGEAYGSVTCNNVNVINSKVSGGCNVGGLIGRNSESHATFTFIDCSVKNTTIEATQAADYAGASAFLGMALHIGDSCSANVVFEGTNVSEGNTITTGEGMQGGGIYTTATYGEETWETPVVVNDFTDYNSNSNN